MVFAQPKICPGKWHGQTPLGFWEINGSPNLSQTTRPTGSQQQKKRTCRVVNFAVPIDHRVKYKESENRDKYFDLAKELKKNPKNCGTWK